tara:strand:- start:75 stop:191 length:117 start_codon:yes stop_codon:yes gene_type:complete
MFRKVYRVLGVKSSEMFGDVLDIIDEVVCRQARLKYRR